MSSNLSVFDSDQFGSVRVVEQDGGLWFVAKDVADSLGYTWAGIRNIQHVPDEWRGVESVSTPSGIQEMLCLSEQGVYFFLARSDKPKALPFQKWLAGDVLPSIRRNGLYATPDTLEKLISDPDTTIKLLQTIKAEREQRLALEEQARLDRPKVLFAEAVDASQSSILIGDFAKILRQNGLNMGQNRLFDWLRDNGYLMLKGQSRNLPTQRSMELGLFEIKERAISNPDGAIRLVKTTRMTGKGQLYFAQKLLPGMELELAEGAV